MKNLITLTLLVAAFALFFGYINPAYGKTTGSVLITEKSIVELKDHRAQYEEALSKAREIERARTGLLEKYNNILPEDQEKLLKLLPDHIDSVRLIIDINNIAAQYGMTLKNITLNEGEGVKSQSVGPTEELYRLVEFRFVVSGAYEDLRSFLKDTEQSLRLIDIESLAFAAVTDTAYDYTVTIRTYRLE